MSLNGLAFTTGQDIQASEVMVCVKSSGGVATPPDLSSTTGALEITQLSVPFVKDFDSSYFYVYLSVCVTFTPAPGVIAAMIRPRAGASAVTIARGTINVSGGRQTFAASGVIRDISDPAVYPRGAYNFTPVLQLQSGSGTMSVAAGTRVSLIVREVMIW